MSSVCNLESFLLAYVTENDCQCFIAVNQTSNHEAVTTFADELYTLPDKATADQHRFDKTIARVF